MLLEFSGRRRCSQPVHAGGGDADVVARRRRYYKTQIDGQLSFEDLVKLAGKGGHRR